MNSIFESFYNNLIAEDRYRMILDGLQVTLLITVCAAILGTILGGLICRMRMSRRTWLQKVAKVYIGEMLRTTIQGIDRGQTEAGLALGYTQRRQMKFLDD